MAGIVLPVLAVLLRVRIPIPVTTHMFAVLILGGIATGILSKLPGKVFGGLTGLVAVGTIIATITVGVDDLRGGTLFARVTGDNCIGWNEYVSLNHGLSNAYNELIGEIETSTLTDSEITRLVGNVDNMIYRLNKGRPPDAAKDLDANWRSLLNETRNQLNSYRAGGDFDFNEINRLINQRSSLIAEANRTCPAS